MSTLGKHWKLSEEIKNKMSERMMGKKPSEETRKKLSESHKGKKQSEETKRKMSETRKGRISPMKGKKQSEFFRQRMKEVNMGKIGFWKGKKLSKETKRKMSEARKKEKHYNWKGGITPEQKIIRNSIEFRLWREAVFARDNWTCQKTGIKGGRLVVHHIQGFAQFPELRFAIDNGITLNQKAHQEFHKKYGIKNNTREQIEELVH